MSDNYLVFKVAASFIFDKEEVNLSNWFVRCYKLDKRRFDVDLDLKLVIHQIRFSDNDTIATDIMNILSALAGRYQSGQSHLINTTLSDASYPAYPVRTTSNPAF